MVEFRTQLGAEAIVERTTWNGRVAIRKVRIPKPYRDPGLDRKIRAERTKQETQILHLAKLSGVPAPDVFFADPKSSEIVMRYMEGPVLKDVASSMNKKDLAECFEIFGASIGSMHSQNLIHGDLTTKNLIVSSKRLFLIDFGLSFHSTRVEDRAEDIHLLKQALLASINRSKAFFCLRHFLEGYRCRMGCKTFDLLMNQIGKIEQRGRYVRVD